MEIAFDIYNTIINDPLYTIIAIAFLILIGYGFIKKLFKFTIIILICIVLYLGYVYFTEGPEQAANEVDKIGVAIENSANTVKEGLESLTNP